MRTLEDAVEEAAATDSVDYEGEDDPAPVLPAPLAPRLGLSADNSNTGDFETYNRAVKKTREPDGADDGGGGVGGGGGT